MGKDKPKRKPSAFNVVVGRLLRVRSFKGQDPAVIRERFRLIVGLARDVLDGRLSKDTAKRLATELSDRLAAGGALGPGPRVAPQRIEKGLLGLFGSHAPIQHGRSRGPATDTRKGRRRN